jgi:hypothetical protein
MVENYEASDDVSKIPENKNIVIKVDLSHVLNIQKSKSPPN